MRRRLIKKLAQLRDKFPLRKEITKDYLELKLSEDDKFYLTLKNKYKDEI